MRCFKITIFGMIRVSFDVRVVNVFFFFNCDFGAFEQHSRFLTLCIIFRAIRSQSPHSSPKVPLRLWGQKVASK